MATTVPPNRAEFTALEVQSATGARSTNRGSARFVGVSTDSRAVRRGELFIALSGEHHDGHRFVLQAIESGASGVVIAADRLLQLPPMVSSFEVSDTLGALGDLARAHRRRWKGTLVGITGSVGKTTTKELVAAGLQACGRRVLRTAGNLNNRIGVPMTLFGLDADVDIAVVEMGTNRAGEIAKLARIAEPDLGVVTAVTQAHNEGLGDLRAVAAEKAALLHAVGPGGIIVFYADSLELRERLTGVSARVQIGFGRSSESDVRLLEVRVIPALRTEVELQCRGITVGCSLRLLGQGSAHDAAAAAAVLLAAGGDLERGIRGFEAVLPVPGRMFPTRTRAGQLVLDDTYNANPESMLTALETARELAAGGRVLVVAGDMRELGVLTEPAHRALGERSAALGIHAFVGCGPAMADAVDAARRSGASRVHHAADAEAGLGLARSMLSGVDVVLVKGSRSMAMERVVAGLTGTGGGKP